MRHSPPDHFEEVEENGQNLSLTRFEVLSLPMEA